MAMNIIEIGLAFLEGVALIASPCILPVLPLVLCTAMEGGRSRPYGIIAGFIMTFSLFALGSASLVRHLHIDLDHLKLISLILLTIFALLLIFESLFAIFERAAQRLGERGNLQIRTNSGLISGLLIGSLIGIVWTPCAGPILAAALVQVIRQESSLNSIFLVISFSVGVGIPMLMIALFGRDLIAKTTFLQKHLGIFRKVLGLLILLSVVYFVWGENLEILSQADEKPRTEPKAVLINPLAVPFAAPEFEGIQTWLNSEPLTIKKLRGNVVLIDFWTYSCINCIRTLPYITAWDKKYRDAGLVIVGVHSPEFEFEKKIDNIKTAIEKFGIQYPVAVDNTLSTWQAFHNLYWPAHYLIDKEGRVVYTHFGEGAYQITEHNISALLNKPDLQVSEMESKNRLYSTQTPETYLGYFRFDNFANTYQLEKDRPKHYIFSSTLDLHQWTLNGPWVIEGEKSISAGNGSALKIHFKAKKVFLVMGNAGEKTITVTVSLNGKPVTVNAGVDVMNSAIQVKEYRLYELIQQPKNAKGLLEINVSDPNLEIFAFTFG